jgi:poly-gamma-glutamate synthesis protein (capsule biosynthesis protein)
MTRHVKITAVGDIMPGDSSICVGWGFKSRWNGEAARDALLNVAPLLKDSDLVIGNLESPLTTVGKGGTRWQRDQMRAEPEVASVLASMGFDVLSVANNHAVQHGDEAFHETVATLRRAGVVVAGLRGTDSWACLPAIVARGSARIGILAYCWRPRQYGTTEPPFAEANVDLAEKDVRRLRLECEHVVVSLHWGDEFFSQPSTSQVQQARRLIDAGASVIVGHHPHVARPVEMYNGGIIAYSLGNFASDMVWLKEESAGTILSAWLSPDGKVLKKEATGIRVANDYRISIGVNHAPTLKGEGVPESEYLSQVALSVRRQRKLAYVHALRHIYHFSPLVLAELLARTILNKVRLLRPRAFS